ncbi:ferritin-like domain-containing protein [Szabonella alba]|uniref:Ferritin-like domain-containing protein n=1 Tax=Szabonella alba TaxID=2804194 RepID=A0A8K0VB08_9RHOB|nr:ferritin-like domain-containing protein [Szabonella alba]MBL4918909.1 ferritin-like domain-containing protein [Szabonella alba]
MDDNIRENYVAWLRDAHAMEEQALTMMRGKLSRLENYPELSARIKTHISETERQAAALLDLLNTRASGSSMMKDAMGKMAASGQALSGFFAIDEVVKDCMGSYAFEHMEIIAYKVLIATADRLGDHRAVSVLQQILVEEQDMADWLFEHTDTITRDFLKRDEADLQASR